MGCGEDVEEAAGGIGADVEAFGHEFAPGHDLADQKQHTQGGGDFPESAETFEIPGGLFAACQLQRSAAGEKDDGVHPDHEGELDWNPVGSHFADEKRDGERHEEHHDRQHRQNDSGLVAARRGWGRLAAFVRVAVATATVVACGRLVSAASADVLDDEFDVVDYVCARHVPSLMRIAFELTGTSTRKSRFLTRVAGLKTGAYIVPAAYGGRGCRLGPPPSGLSGDSVSGLRDWDAKSSVRFAIAPNS